jgi:hypothetical protein
MLTIHLPEGGILDSLTVVAQGRVVKICVSHPNMPDVPEGNLIPNVNEKPWSFFERTSEERDREFQQRMDMQDGYGAPPFRGSTSTFGGG